MTTASPEESYDALRRDCQAYLSERQSDPDKRRMGWLLARIERAFKRGIIKDEEHQYLLRAIRGDRASTGDVIATFSERDGAESKEPQAFSILDPLARERAITNTRRGFIAGIPVLATMLYTWKLSRPIGMLGLGLDRLGDVADEMRKIVLHEDTVLKDLDILQKQSEISATLMDKFRSIYANQQTFAEKLRGLSTRYSDFSKQMNTFSKNGTPIGRLDGTPVKQLAQDIYEKMQRLLTRRDVGTAAYANDFRELSKTVSDLKTAMDSIQSELEKSLKGNDLALAEEYMKQYIALVEASKGLRESIGKSRIGELTPEQKGYADRLLKQKGIDYAAIAERARRKGMSFQLWLPVAGGFLVFFGTGYYMWKLSPVIDSGVRAGFWLGDKIQMSRRRFLGLGKS